MPRRWDPWQVQKAPRKSNAELLYHNNRYHVFYAKFPNRDPEGPDVIHLSIRNNDRSPVRDWRDLQRIKNELVGPEVEMVELFPRESQLVDTSNQFHLWGYAVDQPVFTNAGLGWEQGRLIHDGMSPDLMNDEETKKSVQRPMETPMTEAEKAEMARKWEEYKREHDTKENEQ
jgi:hypothetical protein